MVKRFWFFVNDYSLEPPLVICTWYSAVCLACGFRCELISLAVLYITIFLGYSLDRFFEPDENGFVLAERHRLTKESRKTTFIIFSIILLLESFLMIKCYNSKFIISVVTVCIISLVNLLFPKIFHKYRESLFLGKEFRNAILLTVFVCLFIIESEKSKIFSLTHFILIFSIFLFNLLLISLIDKSNDSITSLTKLQKNPLILNKLILYIFYIPIICVIIFEFSLSFLVFLIFVEITFCLSYFTSVFSSPIFRRRLVDTIFWFIPLLYILFNIA